MPAGSEVPRLARPHTTVTDRVRSGTLASMGTIEGLTAESRGEGEPVPSFLAWLVQQETLTAVLAERVARVQAETSDRLASILLKLGLLSESRLAQALADYCKLPRMNAAGLPSEIVSPDLNDVFIRAREIVPLRLTETCLEVACWDPLDELVPSALSFAVGRTVSRYVATHGEITRALALLYGRGVAGE